MQSFLWEDKRHSLCGNEPNGLFFFLFGFSFQRENWLRQVSSVWKVAKTEGSARAETKRERCQSSDFRNFNLMFPSSFLELRNQQVDWSFRRKVFQILVSSYRTEDLYRIHSLQSDLMVCPQVFCFKSAKLSYLQSTWASDPPSSLSCWNSTTPSVMIRSKPTFFFVLARHCTNRLSSTPNLLLRGFDIFCWFFFFFPSFGWDFTT